MLHAKNIVVRYGAVTAVRGVDLDLAGGEVTALMGRNGSGKSSLLWALQGSGPRESGTVDVQGADPTTLSSANARALVGLVPQTPADLLYLDTVAEECEQADRESGPGTSVSARDLFDRLAPDVSEDAHPRDLSEGQRLALVLAVQLAAAPAVVLLDEPTRGLDYGAKKIAHRDHRPVGGRRPLRGRRPPMTSNSSPPWPIGWWSWRPVTSWPTGRRLEVMVASPSFAPQVAKILAPLDYLTMDQVTDRLGHWSAR